MSWLMGKKRKVNFLKSVESALTELADKSNIKLIVTHIVNNKPINSLKTINAPIESAGILWLCNLNKKLVSWYFPFKREGEGEPRQPDGGHDGGGRQTSAQRQERFQIRFVHC